MRRGRPSDQRVRMKDDFIIIVRNLASYHLKAQLWTQSPVWTCPERPQMRGGSPGLACHTWSGAPRPWARTPSLPCPEKKGNPRLCQIRWGTDKLSIVITYLQLVAVRCHLCLELTNCATCCSHNNPNCEPMTTNLRTHIRSKKGPAKVIDYAMFSD